MLGVLSAPGSPIPRLTLSLRALAKNLDARLIELLRGHHALRHGNVYESMGLVGQEFGCFALLSMTR